jgi:hypothetical protein
MASSEFGEFRGLFVVAFGVFTGKQPRKVMNAVASSALETAGDTRL